MAMEKVFAPSVVSPPWASSTAWKTSTMIPRMLTADGPNRIAPSPVPVMWEQLPVTDGIFSDEITKINAPDMAIRTRFLLFSFTLFRSEINPAIRNGRQTAPHATQYPAGR